MTTIKQGDWSYTLTPTDKLWAARMVEGEGPPEDTAAILWTMTQLFSPAGQRRKYGRPDRFPTFTALIQAYSQPINPIWRRDGSKCRPGGSHSGTDSCSPTRLARRDAIASKAYGSITPAKRAIVEQWFAGSLPNPVPGATEFADPRVSRSFLDRHPGWTMRSGGSNWFLSSPDGIDRVTVGGLAVGGVVLFVGALGVVWFGARWLARRRR